MRQLSRQRRLRNVREQTKQLTAMSVTLTEQQSCVNAVLVNSDSMSWIFLKFSKLFAYGDKVNFINK